MRLRNTFWILDAEHHVVEVDMLAWAKWFEVTSNRIVDWTQLRAPPDEIAVSTIFLGTEHVPSLLRGGPPTLFETMIFGGTWDQYCWRYASWDDAVTGHKVAVRKARKALVPT